MAQALASTPEVPDQALDTREALARAARLSAGQVKMIETIQQKAAPEVVAAVKAGELSLNAAAVVATLPVEEQQAVPPKVPEGLKQAAKRVREAKKKPKADKPAAADEGSLDAAPLGLRRSAAGRVTELEAENERLRLQVKTLQELLAEQA